MPDIPTITWRQLTGNKFSKAIDSAMISDAGCITQQRIRRTGDAVKQQFLVKYDSDYLLQFILRKFVRLLSAIGRKKLIKLVNDAYDLYDKETLTPQGLSEDNN